MKHYIRHSLLVLFITLTTTVLYSGITNATAPKEISLKSTLAVLPVKPLVEVPEPPKPEIKPSVVEKAEVVPVPPPPPELTLEEKIAKNVNNCTENQYIRADNAECLDKQPQTAITTYSQASPSYTSGNSYYVGYCTWYVKNMRRDLPNNLGNANEWLYNAQAQGYATGSQPRSGAVGVNFAGYYGHVVYVQEVYPNGTILISEMNYVGWNIVSSRVTGWGEFSYIY